MSRTAAKTPKIKANKKTLDAYQKANEEGCFINIPKFERLIESGSLDRLDDYEEKEKIESIEVDLDVFDVEELKSLLQTAVDDEDYESAAALRDAINEIENKNKK
jgi:excinuclease UvrABC helicase subunit UvrB